MTRRALLALLLAVAGLAAWAGPAMAAGPWRGQAVDAETNQPLEGVIVVAQWDKIGPGVVHKSRYFHDVEELVTGVDGRFVIPARSRLTLNPFVTLDGPMLHMFKPGYGQWRNLGLPFPSSVDEVRSRMERNGVVFAFPLLKTWEERGSSLPLLPMVPEDKIPRFAHAVKEERKLVRSHLK
jgi:hypothetical protein